MSDVEKSWQIDYASVKQEARQLLLLSDRGSGELNHELLECFSSSGSAVTLQQHAPTYLANFPHKVTWLVNKGTGGIRVLAPTQLHSHQTQHRLGV